MKTLLLIITMLMPTIAIATGGTSCRVETEDILLEVGLVNGRYYGSPIVANSIISIKLKDTDLGFLNSTIVTFKKTYEKNEIYSWFNYDGEMRLASHKEVKTTHGTAEIVFVVKTDRTDDWEYKGSFSVELFHGSGPRKWTGDITCDYE